uniref:Uncharacterized protein n=1 Tax=Arundo donax TaxID=35708 RepID=A0A0A9H2X6_ARUDO
MSLIAEKWEVITRL